MQNMLVKGVQSTVKKEVETPVFKVLTKIGACILPKIMQTTLVRQILLKKSLKNKNQGQSLLYLTTL
jgi:hypothetical protein